jgi:hypothetical protein
MHTGRRLALVGAVLAIGVATRAAGAQTSFTLPDTSALGPEERSIMRLEQERSAAIARHDTAYLRRVYADEFRGVTAAGIPVDRETLLGVFTRDDPTTVFTIDEISLRLLGASRDAALYTARLTTKRRATGEQVAQSRFIHVYVRRDGRWQILAAQGSLVRTGCDFDAARPRR